MRLSHLNPDDCQQRYDADLQCVDVFEFRNQSSWYFHANALLRLAKVSYALGCPIEECQMWFRRATHAYRELFSLRGTSFTKVTRYKDGQPLPEETIAEDGYTSVDSFNAACSALAVHDFRTARELVHIAGHSPNAKLVAPRSEVCNSNEQTISHALNALLDADLALANREAGKLAVRRATKVEKQIGLIISAIATNGDVLTERDALLFYHEKLATRRDNQLDCGLWICLPALALTSLAIHVGPYSTADLATKCVYCPLEMLAEPELTGG